MRGVAPIVLVLLLVAPVGEAASPRNPARLQVVAKEFSLVLSRQSVKAGPVIVELVNLGEDPHDLKLRRIGGTKTYTIREVLPGKRGQLETKLRTGKFRVWCAVAGHHARGMRATLRVR